MDHDASFRIQQIQSIAGLKTLLEASLPPNAGREAFIEDLGLVVDMFSALFEVNEVGIRLQSVAGAPCPAFHNDRIPCRLLLTYLGAGSQWMGAPISSSVGLKETLSAYFGSSTRVNRHAALVGKGSDALVAYVIL